ncbi:hypothetical protein [Dictyobacter arantiisoli]|uniref:Uncharacterized protein n=1 Tax=Dictyobacter arantiisoli TaxID=2014874 RepID=A0A5A5TIE5_9CHLR|nr:hypothetical protein [Dictyobacter arantiisoli]GCF10886.1 hypothetical protein KDI_44500 [Dictyobacter arantiisoli]
MSDAIIFNYPYNLFLMERLEFVLITQDDLEAKIMRLVEYEMIKKKEKWQAEVTNAIEAKIAPSEEPKEYWCQLSHAQIIGKLYKFDAAKVGGKHPLSISKATIRKALNNIVEKGWLLTRTAPDDEFGAPQYTLNRQAIQTAMNELPKDPFSLFYLEKTPLKIFEGGGQNNSGAPSKILRGGGQNNSGAPLKIFEDLKDSNKDSLKDKDKESSSYAAPKKQTSEPPLSTTAAAAILTISQLKNLAPEELARLKAEIDTLMGVQQQEATDVESQPSPALKEMAAELQNGQEDQLEHNVDEEVEVEVEVVEEQPQKPERPGADAPRTAEMVVQLIEYLRGTPYAPRERMLELRKAALLLSQKDVPDVSLAAIEEAWLHGSDDYWRERHGGDDLHVHDLVNRDSKGILRLQAFLEHKRAQDRRQPVSLSSRRSQREVATPQSEPTPQATLSEEQAQAIVAQIAQDAAAHGYDLHGVAKQEGAGWKVQGKWRSVAWKDEMDLEIYSERQWMREFKEWQEVIEIGTARRQRQ